MNKLKFKKLHNSAYLPTRGSEYSCGLDIYSIEEKTLKSGERAAVRTGLSVEIPELHYGRIAPRSGLALKYGVDVLAGVIDSDYRGEILCLIVNLGQEDFRLNIGDRIAQLIIEKVSILKPEWCESLNSSDRDMAGFGSTGT